MLHVDEMKTTRKTAVVVIVVIAFTGANRDF